jgi:molecular chaperone DnaK
MPQIIGIDLGTTNSEAAVMEGGQPRIILNASTESRSCSDFSSYHGALFPSVVAFTLERKILVGEPARRQAVINPERTVWNIKRKMGTDYKVTIDGKKYSSQEISAIILRKIKENAERYLDEKIKQAVISVPAYFNDNQRQATKDAGAIAGLEVIRLINEPTAAALAYGVDKKVEQKIIVLDFGGGTFDITLMHLKEGVFDVIATSGDTQLGGMDMDNILIDYVWGEFKKDEGINIDVEPEEELNPLAMQRMREAVEKAKIELSTALSTTICLPFLIGTNHLEVPLTRDTLERLVEPVLRRLDTPIRTVLEDAGLKSRDIDKILLIGGPTKMPIVREKFKKILHQKPEMGVDPMVCVAMGTAIQAGILKGEISDWILLDVTPLSTGIETLGGIFTRIIERNTTIPTRHSKIFATSVDYQSSVEIHVLQGERPMALDNITLGRFSLAGIPSAPRGISKVEVLFDIDADGIMHVFAEDVSSGKTYKIKITASTKLEADVIERKIKEGEEFAEEDRKKVDLATLLNEIDLLIYTMEKTLKEADKGIGIGIGKDKGKNKSKSDFEFELWKQRMHLTIHIETVKEMMKKEMMKKEKVTDDDLRSMRKYRDELSKELRKLQQARVEKKGKKK